ncbi:transposase [Aestuariibius sp. 2305UL40-4]|uniref:transposase n=1 Tax=Aestuariibius violaceus TaxID=3234132 RepID=UPI00345EE2F3
MRARLKKAERHKAELEREAKALIQTDAVLRAKFDIFTSIPNVGAVTAMALIADLPELGRLNAKQVAALVGVARMS